jgi:hypothetical protein
MATFNMRDVQAQTLNQGEVVNNHQNVAQGENVHQGSWDADQDMNDQSFLLISHIYRLAGEGRIDARTANDLCALIRTGAEAREPARRNGALARAKEIMRNVTELSPAIDAVEKLIRMLPQGT